MSLRTKAWALGWSLVSLPLAARAEEGPRFDVVEALTAGATPLDEAKVLTLVRERSPRLEAARAAAAAAEAGIKKATAALFPRLELGARYAHIDGFPDGKIGTPPDPAALEAARMLAGAVQDPAARTLLLGSIEAQASAGQATIAIPRNQIGFQARLLFPVSDVVLALLPALEGTEARARSEALRVEVTRAEVSLAALEAYHRHVEARGGLAVAEAARRQAGEQLEQVKRYVASGVLPPAEGASAEARVAEVDEAVARARGAVAVTERSLSLLLGTSGTYAIPAEVLEEPPPPAEAGDLEARALTDRAELRALREGLASLRAVRDATWASGLPHLGVYAAGDVSNPSPRMIPPKEVFQPSYEFGATLSWSPNDYASSRFGAEELDAQIAKGEAELAAVEDLVRLEVARSRESLAAAREARRAAALRVAAAEEAYAARLAELTAGEVVVTEVGLADTRLSEARLAHLRAAVEIRLERARLERAVGR